MPAAFLGRGWPFPIKPDPTRQMAYLSGAEKIRQSIWIILSTAPGERQMRPDFGCGIHDLVFEPNTAALRGVVRARVQDALIRWEPRIDLLNVNVAIPGPGERNYLLIHIDYRIRSNNAFFNLVYPFFINEGAG
ncbi:MAG: GPW/gp25 family protein [Candidatus Promineifilaceae bacterium]|nr:GPW/gp25 family protein [Candidatus Promineifilaceae bacterium]